MGYGFISQSPSQSGTWTPSFTGFSADPTSITATYILDGKLCFFNLAMSPGTSNSTSFTVTLPFPSKTTGAKQRVYGTVTNNGTQATTPGVLRTTLNSNVADMFLTLAESAGSWNSAAFGKGCLMFGFYEIA